MIYTEKAYIAAAQALARATTEQAAKTRARIIRLMIEAEQPADQARARELVADGEEEPPDWARTPFFLQAARLIRANGFDQPKPKPENSNVPTSKQPTDAGLRFEHSRHHT
jgi:hypothetical protein